MASFDEGYRVGIVGATGAVGIEVISCLRKCSFPVASLHLYASAKSAGKLIDTEFGSITIEEFSIEASRSCHFVFLAVSGEFALENAQKICAGDGPVVIDNSSAFRYDVDIPLVVRVVVIVSITSSFASILRFQKLILTHSTGPNS